MCEPRGCTRGRHGHASPMKYSRESRSPQWYHGLLRASRAGFVLGTSRAPRGMYCFLVNIILFVGGRVEFSGGEGLINTGVKGLMLRA
eukprot:1187339-Prorocentrum_minimum.AAC.3